MVALLLDAGAEVDGRNDGNEHWSPLMLSYWMENAKIRALLLSRGARIGLCEALLAGDDDQVDTLLAKGEPPIPEDRPRGLLALARTPHAVDRLLDLGVSPDEVDRWGADAMEALSRLGPRGRPLVERLKEEGVRVSAAELARMGECDALERLYSSRASEVIAEKSPCIFIYRRDH